MDLPKVFDKINNNELTEKLNSYKSDHKSVEFFEKRCKVNKSYY